MANSRYRFLWFLSCLVASCLFISATVSADEAGTHTDIQGLQSYGIGFRYMPSGTDTQIKDATGNTYRLVGNNHTLDASLDATYQFSTRVRGNMKIGAASFYERVQVMSPLPSMQVNAGTTWHTAGSIYVRPTQDGAAQPEFSLGMGYPWLVTVGTSLTVTKDPTVLTAATHYINNIYQQTQTLSFNWGAGLVTNECINLGFSINQVLPLHGSSIPKTTALLNVTYAWGHDAMHEVDLQTDLELVSGRSQAGFRGKWRSLNKALQAEHN